MKIILTEKDVWNALQDYIHKQVADTVYIKAIKFTDGEQYYIYPKNIEISLDEEL